MDTSAIFLLVVVILAAGLFVARPFIRRSRVRAVDAEEQGLSALMAERDRLITALQELDFDHTLGKIPAEDYPGMRAGLMQHAAEVLHKLDISQAHPSLPAEVEDRIEAVIAARRADAVVGKSPSSEPDASEDDDNLETLLASRKAARKEKSAGFCAQCGKAVQRSDRFCPHCGKRLT